MSAIGVHPRVARRHPELSDEDVRAAVRSSFRYRQREGGAWCAVGFDTCERLVEIVYRYDEESDFFFVYHAMTPPSGKTLRELELER